MAAGYAKFTGRLGVCLATSGPGGIHLLNGLYDAKYDGQPVLAITGGQAHDTTGTYYQQDVDLIKVMADVAACNERVMGPDHVVNILDQAIRTALGQRTVAHITFPKDYQEWTASDDQRSSENVPDHTSAPALSMAVAPTLPQLQRAANVIKRRPEGGDSGRPGLPGCPRRGAGPGRKSGRAHRQGAAGQGRSARRQPLYHRWPRAAGHCPLARPDGGLRHADNDWQPLPLPRLLP